MHPLAYVITHLRHPSVPLMICNRSQNTNQSHLHVPHPRAIPRELLHFALVSILAKCNCKLRRQSPQISQQFSMALTLDDTTDCKQSRSHSAQSQEKVKRCHSVTTDLSLFLLYGGMGCTYLQAHCRCSRAQFKVSWKLISGTPGYIFWAIYSKFVL